MTGPGRIDDLTTQLADFLDLVDSQGLPPLYEVRLLRVHSDPTWHAEAQVFAQPGRDQWSTLWEWCVATGGTVRVGEPHQTSFGEKPWRRVDVVVSHVGLEVRIWNHVDADDPIPVWALPKPEAQSAPDPDLSAASAAWHAEHPGEYCPNWLTCGECKPGAPALVNGTYFADEPGSVA